MALDTLSEQWFNNVEIMFRSQGWAQFREQLQSLKHSLGEELKYKEAPEVYRVQGMIRTTEQLLGWEDFIANLKAQQFADGEDDADI